MTLHFGDIASYQKDLRISDLLAAGFRGINVKVSHGLTQRSVHPQVATYVREARAAGMQLLAFHWLTGDASGVAQADYCYRQLAVLGLNVPGVAALVDVEGTADGVGGEPTPGIYGDFVRRMRALLGRPIGTYSGAWWARSRSWLTASADSPWLHSAPAAGYVPTYPGDSSDLWDTGYAGWEALSIMQYRVAPIAGIQVSQSAIRSADVLSAMTGGMMASWILVPCLVKLRSEFNEVAPNRDKGADGSIGDTSHAASSSDHNPDETGNTPYEDADSINEVHAIDIDCTGPWPDGNGGGEGDWFDRKIRAIAAREEVEYESATILGRLQNIIWRGHIISRSWGWSEWRVYTGASQHYDHAHFSARYVTSTEADTRPWGVVTEEDEVTEAELLAAFQKYFTSADGKKALGEAVWYFLTTAPAGSNDADGMWRVLSFLTNVYPAAVSARTYSADARTAAQAALVKVTEDDSDRDAIIAAVQAQNSIDVQALGAMIAAALGPNVGGATPQEVEEAVNAGLRQVFADAASPDSSPA